MNLLYISIIQLSKYKVFIGHSIWNALITSSWLIFNIRGKISILNLYNTLKMLKLSYIIIKHVVGMGFPFWFINFDLTKEDVVKQSAFDTGEFYVTRRWIRGLVSNYYEITKVYRNYLIKKDYIDSNTVRDIFDKWFFTRFTWPRALFISNEKNSEIFYKETVKSKVSTIGLVDLNVKSHIYNIPIACNDDSLESISFMHNVMAQLIMKCKYKKVLIWYCFSKNKEKNKTLIDWLSFFFKKKKKLIYKFNLKKVIIPKYVNEYRGLKFGFKFFLSRSSSFKLFFKKDHEDSEIFDQFYDLSKRFIYNRLKVLNYKILSKKFKLKYRRRVKLNKIEGLSAFKSFLNNLIKLYRPLRRFKRLKIKKRIRMEKRQVSSSFKSLYYFIYFFFLNKFNIVIDSYYKKSLNLYYLVRIFKSYKKRKYRYKYKNLNIDMFSKKLRYFYVFRYKSKKVFRKWKRKKNYGSVYDSFRRLNIRGSNKMAFLFFYWKFFMLFLGLKLRNRFLSLKLRKLKVLRLKKK